MADISGLSLKKLDETNWDEYPVGGGGGNPPHDPGAYIGAYDSFEFQAKNGYLMIVANGKIVDPEEGREESIRDYLFTKPIEQGRRKGACRAGDFLLACGSEKRPGSDPQEWADAIEECQNAQFQFNLDWSCYDGEEGKEVAGTWGDFPVDKEDATKRLPYVEVERKDGKTQRLRGRQRVRFYIADRGNE